MAANVEITRTQIIVVDEVGENTYGDLTFTDKEGKEYKVRAKRRQYFEKVILPGVAVLLNYSTYKGTEYIYSASKVEDGLPDIPKSKESLEVVTKPSPVVRTKDEQIERAVWIKELGECIRSGDIDKTTPQGKALRNAYYAEMLRVLGINIKEPANLIEEAKRMGAKEINKET